MNDKMKIRCAVIGYGPTFNMGKIHCEQIKATNGLELVAICDADTRRTEAARNDFPEIITYNDLDKMLMEEDFELAVIVTPPNTHSDLALQCLKNGKHVIVEKPMCITTSEATIMIEEAKKRNLMLTVFQNRRFDGDFLTLKEIINKGQIGQVFHIEFFRGEFRHPGTWWRSNKKVSGGAFYDWGAHVLDWILNIVPSNVKGVVGCFHKLVWMDVTNEDQVEALIRFENGTVANVQISTIASISKPRWRVLGSKGGIMRMPEQQYFHMVTYENGNAVETKVQFKNSEWSAYYQNIANHLLHGTELLVKPEEARRVIAIMEAAEKSSKTGTTVKPLFP